MKKIIIALAVLLAVQVADAQVKSASAAKKAVEAAEAASQDAKKATKVATWIKLAKAYMDAYNSPKGAAANMLEMRVGAQDVQIALMGEKPSATEQITLAGAPGTKEVYKTREYLYDMNGIFTAIRVTKPLYKNALAKALNAYKKAYEVDLKKSKEKDIKAGIEQITKAYFNDALAAYYVGDYTTASKYFAKSAEASVLAPYNSIHLDALYNAGFTAHAVKDYAAAKKYFESCLENKHNAEGEVYRKLSETYAALDNKDKAREILEEGMLTLPKNQGIIIDLINIYLQDNQDPDRLISLLKSAQQNDPTNVSLWSVEGDIYRKLGKFDAAETSYRTCIEKNPNVDAGYVGLANNFVDLYNKYYDEAQNERDDRKYAELINLADEALLKTVEPFEKAFEIAADAERKLAIADMLKQICYKLSAKDAAYKESYDKYKSYIDSNSKN
jgi:tetratricopeptide (TPR) repeat protein